MLRWERFPFIARSETLLTEGQEKNNAAAKEKKQNEAEEHLFEGADSLIIATTRADVKSLLQATYPFLLPGQPFSIYSPYIEVPFDVLVSPYDHT